MVSKSTQSYSPKSWHDTNVSLHWLREIRLLHINKTPTPLGKQHASILFFQITSLPSYSHQRTWCNAHFNSYILFLFYFALHHHRHPKRKFPPKRNGKHKSPTTNCKLLRKYKPLVFTKTLTHCNLQQLAVSSSTATNPPEASPNSLKKPLSHKKRGKPKIFTQVSSTCSSSFEHPTLEDHSESQSFFSLYQPCPSLKILSTS